MCGFFLWLEIRSLTLMACPVYHFCNAVAWGVYDSWLSTGEHLKVFVCGRGLQGPWSESGEYEPVENALTSFGDTLCAIRPSSEGPGGIGHWLTNLIMHVHLAFHLFQFTLLNSSSLEDHFPNSVICI